VVVQEVHRLGLQVRAGLQAGECEVMGDKLGGMAVRTGARVASLAGPDEVLVSSTVKDLVAGSGTSVGLRPHDEGVGRVCAGDGAGGPAWASRLADRRRAWAVQERRAGSGRAAGWTARGPAG
jgi:class 3 adenylate cyclase